MRSAKEIRSMATLEYDLGVDRQKEYMAMHGCAELNMRTQSACCSAPVCQTLNISEFGNKEGSVNQSMVY